jgi:Tfp pilus assembly protein PilO
MPKFKLIDIIVIVVMVIAIACLGVGISYYSGLTAETAAQRKAKEQELAGIKQKVAAFQSLQDEVARNEADFNRLASYLPDREGQAEFIMELDQLHELSGVELQSCSIADAPKPFPDLANYVIYEWKVTYKSDYGQLIKLLEALPSQPRSTMVSDINISASQPDQASNAKSEYDLSVQLTYNLISTTEPKKVVQ